MKRILLISAVSLMSANLYADAQGSAAPAEQPDFNQVDTNQDGAISKQEASSFSALEGVFESADKNQDGMLDTQEFALTTETKK